MGCEGKGLRWQWVLGPTCTGGGQSVRTATPAQRLPLMVAQTCQVPLACVIETLTPDTACYAAGPVRVPVVELVLHLRHAGLQGQQQSAQLVPGT